MTERKKKRLTLEETIDKLGSIYYNDFRKAIDDALYYLKEYRDIKETLEQAQKHTEEYRQNFIQGLANIQKRGRWIWDEEDICRCSECGNEDDLSMDGVYMMHDFCPNCGSDNRHDYQED